MILSSLFTSFLFGLLISDPSNQPHLSCLEPMAVLVGLGFIVAISPSRFRLILACLIAFFFGVIWITWLPTWPALIEQAQGKKCAIRGRTVCEAFDIGSSRFLPVSINSINIPPHDEWVPSKGVVVLRISRSDYAEPGSELQACGILSTESELLHSAGVLRFMPRAILDLGGESGGVTLTGKPGLIKAPMNALRYRLVSHLSWGTGASEAELITGITMGRQSSSRNTDWSKDF
jgi:hypothetical protein